MKQNIKKTLRTNTLLTKISCSLIIAINAFNNVGQALPLNNSSEAISLQECFFSKQTTEIDCPTAFYSKAASHFQLSVFGDYVLDRNLTSHFQNGMLLDNAKTLSSFDRVKQTSIYSTGASLNYNFFDFIDIYGSFGITNINISGACTLLSYMMEDKAFPVVINYSQKDTFSKGSIPVANATYLPTYNNSINCKSNLTAGAGLRATILKYKNLRGSIQGQFKTFTTKNYDISSKPFNVVYPVNFNGSIYKFETTVSHNSKLNSLITYQEWSVGGGLSYNMGNCSPYIGATYSSTALYSKGPIIQAVTILKTSLKSQDILLGSFNYRNNSNYGAVLGLTTKIKNKIIIETEGRFGSEKGLSITAKVKL